MDHLRSQLHTDGKVKAPRIITAAAVTGLLLSCFSMLLGISALEPFLMLSLLPGLFCIGLLVWKSGVFAILYIAVFLLARFTIFLPENFNILSAFMSAGIVVFFAFAAAAAFRYKASLKAK